LKRITIFFAAFVAMLIMPASGYAQSGDPGPSREQIINTNYSGPIFQDAFWTDRATPPPEGSSFNKIEVAPGEGSAVLAVLLVNRGVSDITAITGHLQLPSGFMASGGGSQAVETYDRIVQEGESFALLFQVDVREQTQVLSYNAPLMVEYSRVVEVGSFRSADLNVPFRLTGKVILDAQAETKGIAPGSTSEVKLSLSNKGSAPATGVIVTVSGAGAVQNGNTAPQTLVASVGPKTFEVGTIPPQGSVEIKSLIHASSSARDTSQSLNLQVSYGDAYGAKQSVAIPVELVVLPRALESDLDITSSGNSATMITAGKLHDYEIVVSNIADRPISDVLITLESRSDSIKILGDSEWTVKSMDAGYRQGFKTQIFAPIDMIGSPTTFSVNVDYLSPTGQSTNESVDLGAYVDGEISIRAYEIAANYIGGSPNIVGNLLNEGNTLALFTTIELTDAGNLVSSLPPQQYIGDLEENSPLPFSIPVDVGSSIAGTYPVSFKVTYKDNLRQLSTLVINSDVMFEPEKVTDQSANGVSAMGAALPIAIGVAIAAAIAAIIIITRRRKAALKRTIKASKHEDDIESLLDSQHLGKRPDERK
jgi:hypothetical protein